MAGGFGLRYGGWRTLIPEDSSGRINEQQLRDAIYEFQRDVNRNRPGMAPTPWKAGGLDGLREQQAWRKMVDAKQAAVARKNALIDAAERGDEDAIKELNDIMAKEKNLMALKQMYRLPKMPTRVEGLMGDLR